MVQKVLACSLWCWRGSNSKHTHKRNIVQNEHSHFVTDRLKSKALTIYLATSSIATVTSTATVGSLFLWIPPPRVPPPGFRYFIFLPCIQIYSDLTLILSYFLGMTSPLTYWPSFPLPNQWPPPPTCHLAFFLEHSQPTEMWSRAVPETSAPTTFKRCLIARRT